MNQIKMLKEKGIAFDVEVSGKRGQSYFKFQQVPTTASYSHFEEKPKFEEVAVLVDLRSVVLWPALRVGRALDLRRRRPVALVLFDAASLPVAPEASREGG